MPSMALWLAILAGGAVSSPAAAAELRVRVVGLPSDGGTVWCSLYRDPGGWLRPDGAAQRVSARPERRAAECVFPEVPPGVYAAAILHDTDGNGDMTYAAGLPQEWWGVSRDASIRLGRPRWADAAFDHPRSAPLVTARRLR